MPNGFDVSKLAEFKAKGVPVVSVFLSGRPLWTNPEINNSDAFVAAWLPGSEGGGISDLLFKRDPSYDFTGRLSFSWPASAVVSKDSEPLYKLGYGLSYKENSVVNQLSEKSGLENIAVASTGEFFNKGAAVAPWGLFLSSGDLTKQIASFPTSVGGLIISKTDHNAQEDALRIKWTKADHDQMRISTAGEADMLTALNDKKELTFSAKSFTSKKAIVQIGICDESSSCNKTIDINITPNQWNEYRISLSCFEKLGIDLSKIKTALMITADSGIDIGLSNIRLESDTDGKANCGK